MKHLRYFDALARHHHFGRAAEECNVTQPALSVQIKELEALIGASLVERGSRQIHLDSFGRCLCGTRPTYPAFCQGAGRPDP